eukprot:9866413-Alexandrium_andersonii.AAC.1
MQFAAAPPPAGRAPGASTDFATMAAGHRPAPRRHSGAPPWASLGPQPPAPSTPAARCSGASATSCRATPLPRRGRRPG